MRPSSIHQMTLLTANHCRKINGGSSFGRREKSEVSSTESIPQLRFRANVKAFAARKSAKRLRNSEREQKDVVSQSTSGSPLDDEYKKDGLNSVSLPARNSVVQACTVTSALIAALGLGVRQASHVAASAGLPILDCTAQVSFDFEIWHLELIAGSVVLISSSRYLLLKTWPDFAKSSEAANRQVLTSLDPFDYLIVAFLSGVSEELLFRGALLPLFGLNWKSALVAAAIFGILHVGNGRNYSFAAWATFVGLAYGYATISSSTMVVPMASHALNNLVGAVLWSYTSKSSQLRE